MMSDQTDRKYARPCDVCLSWYCCPLNHIDSELTPDQARNLAKAELECITLSNGRARMLARAVLRYIAKE